MLKHLFSLKEFTENVNAFNVQIVLIKTDNRKVINVKINLIFKNFSFKDLML